MGDVHYMISEAAKQVGVEPHVLRYWEEELSLCIGRTEMGHRYYTKEDIQLFCCVRKLKEQGMPLKEMKTVIPDLIHTKNQLKMRRMALLLPPAEQNDNLTCNMPDLKSENIESDMLSTLSKDDIRTLLRENNEILSLLIQENMELLLKAKEIREEDRYRSLDSLIRNQQEYRREASKNGLLGKFHRFMEA